MLKRFLKFFKTLNSNSHPGEIAHAVSIGLIMGFLPKTNALWYILAVFFLFIRINKGAFFIYTFLFSLLAPALDNLFDKIGYAVLTFDKLEVIFDAMLNTPFVSFTRFNNTIVMGSLVSGIVLYIPAYIIARLILKLWRTLLAPAIRKAKIIVYLSNVKFIKQIGDTYASLA